jgi:transaldolase
LILAASKKEGYAHLIDAAVKYAKEKGGNLETQANNAVDRLVSKFRKEEKSLIAITHA